MRKIRLTREQGGEIVRSMQELFECDAVRLSNPLGVQLFLIVGNYRNTKHDEGQWYKNGKPINFRYLAEYCVASGTMVKGLLREMRRAHRIGLAAPPRRGSLLSRGTKG